LEALEAAFKLRLRLEAASLFHPLPTSRLRITLSLACFSLSSFWIARNLLSSSRIARAAIVLRPAKRMVIAMNIIQSDLSSPSSIEMAGRTHRNIFIAYLGWLVIAGLVTAFFAWALWRANNRRQEAVKTEADARIAEALQKTEELRERADALESQNLILQTDLTKLQIEQAEMHERVQETRRKLDPRVFTEVARSQFLRKTSETTGTIDILCVGDRSSEACNFANAVARALKQTDWTVSAVEQIPLTELSRFTDDPLIKRAIEGTGLAVIVERRAPFENNRAAGFLHDALALGGFFAPVCVTGERAGKPPLLLVGPKRLKI